MRRYFIETWGCQMNLHDSERLQGQLDDAGWRSAGSPAEADLVLLNTCSVREKPMQKIISRIGALSQFQPAPHIAVCGCVAQQEEARLFEASPRVRLVLGPSQIPRLTEALPALERGERVILTGFEHPYARSDYDAISRSSNTRGMITVIEGCDEFCTFCVVPYTRGRERSRPIDHVLAEVRELVARGVPEVELLGQTINAYRCPETDATFSTLLERVAQVEGARRVRFVTSHPRHFGDDLIDVLARHDTLSRYLHLPVQAGSDRILKRMHRRYTRDEYLELIRRIRTAVPDVNLSTDIIVGFPGESEEDFQHTIDILAEVRFGQVFAFAYSARPRTPAAQYTDSVSEETKKERLHRLFALTDRISEELNAALVGHTVEVLIDGDSRRSVSDWQGRGDDNRVVNFAKTGGESIGDLVPVTITGAGAHSLKGRRADRCHALPVA